MITDTTDGREPSSARLAVPNTKPRRPSTAAQNHTLWSLTRGQRLRYGAAILAMAIANLFVFAVPLISRSVIDDTLGTTGRVGWIDRLSAEIFGEASTALTLLVAAGLTILLTLCAGFFTYLRGRWTAISSESIVRRLRDHLYDHLGKLPCSYHDRADTGDLVQRCTSDVETIRVFLAAHVVTIGRAILLLLTVLPIMAWLDARLAVVAVAVFPIVILFAFYFFQRIKSLFQLVDQAEGQMTTVLQENLTGIRVVRAFARQEHECTKFAAKNKLFRDHNHRLIRLLGVYWATSDFLCEAQLGMVLAGGAYWMTQGELTAGDLFAFLTFEMIIIWPVRHMGRVLADLGKASVSLGRVREILSEPEESNLTPSASSRSSLVRGAGRLKVSHLRFAYDDGENVLDDVSFDLDRGETLALLGPPGAGKSTLIHLLLRLYDADRGMVYLDGCDVLDLPRSFVRSQFAVVLQEPFLYSRTIAANIRVANQEAHHSEIEEVASTADMHTAITNFDYRYDTIVGERGVTLSGGQRQRIALARALLKHAPILILDDAFSAVDTNTEAEILKALSDRRGLRTTIVIAHRLSTVRHADHVLFLDQGRVVQSGTHAQLIETTGAYRRLWEIQTTIEKELKSSPPSDAASEVPS